MSSPMAMVYLGMLLSMGDGTTAQDGMDKADGDPLVLARTEGVIRERITMCPMQNDLRVHALGLSARAAEAIVRVYGLTARELETEIATGMQTARMFATDTADNLWCDPAEQQCLLRVLSDRDASVSELLGPTKSMVPAAWPTSSTVACEGDGPPRSTAPAFSSP